MLLFAQFYIFGLVFADQLIVEVTNKLNNLGFGKFCSYFTFLTAQHLLSQ